MRRRHLRLVSLREDVHLETDPQNDRITLVSRWGDTVLPRPAEPVLEAMRRMMLGPIALENVLSSDLQHEELDAVLGQVAHLVIRSLGAEPGRPLVSVVPLTPESEFTPSGDLPVRPIRLSRFAQISADGGMWSIESGLSLHRALIHHPGGLALIAPLAAPLDPSDADDELLSVARYLLAAGLVVQADGEDRFESATFAEDSDPALRGWTPIDLMFHTRSTLGRHDNDFGATYPTDERQAPESVVKPAGGEPARVSFPAPQAAAPAVEVLASSRPTKRFTDTPISLADLSELLFHTVRVRQLIGSSDPDSALASDRPYLGSTDAYELEVYAAVRHCDGLPPDIYHYDPYRHQLESTDRPLQDVEDIHTTARVEGDLHGDPAVVLMITARFRRLSWKYAGLTYALVLKDVGAMTQSLLLAATAQELGGCGLYSPNIESMARILGTDWRTESAVGGFAFGHAADVRQTTPITKSAAQLPTG